MSGEVSNLYEALLINKSKHPNYFRYLAPEEQVSKIDRARFPTLAAVAQKIKAELMGDKSVLQIVSKVRVRDDLVADLFEMHKRAMGTHTPAFILRMLDEMFAAPTSYDDEVGAWSWQMPGIPYTTNCFSIVGWKN